jgi:Mn-dependent DtxR family transcriptional regulator
MLLYKHELLKIFLNTLGVKMEEMEGPTNVLSSSEF